jgi:hypothetical protein
MIDIAKLTEKDKGRAVVYCPRVGPREQGAITSWNEQWIFVRYRPTGDGVATRPEDLEWL